MDQLADRLEAAAGILTAVDRSMPGLAVPRAAFAAGPDAGMPGRIGGELHDRWQAVLEARAREAAATAARLNHLADSVRDTARRYTGTDHTAAESVHAAAGGYAGTDGGMAGRPRWGL